MLDLAPRLTLLLFDGQRRRVDAERAEHEAMLAQVLVQHPRARLAEALALPHAGDRLPQLRYRVATFRVFLADGLKSGAVIDLAPWSA